MTRCVLPQSVLVLFLGFVPLVAGCGPDDRPSEAGFGEDAGRPGVDASEARPDASQPPTDAIVTGKVVVYAHSASTLYKIEPTTLEVHEIGAFEWSDGGDEMTDIALDKDGNMLGVSNDSVYSIDGETAKATKLAEISGKFFVALSFVPESSSNPLGPEKLVAATSTSAGGELYGINPVSGETWRIGSYGENLRTSGDIVSVRGLGTYVTVRGTDSDQLAKLDPTTGQATVVGDTTGPDGPVSQIYGLAFWGNYLYGVTGAQQFVLIDPATGYTTVQQVGDVVWWGAGVSTSAPVID